MVKTENEIESLKYITAPPLPPQSPLPKFSLFTCTVNFYFLTARFEKLGQEKYATIGAEAALKCSGSVIHC
jgi:hypothetical protein